MKRFNIINILLLFTIITGCNNYSSLGNNIAQSYKDDPKSQMIQPNIDNPIHQTGQVINNNKQLAEFHTEFDSKKSARGKNIIRGSLAIDQKIIQPGEVFSFNNTVGPTTRKNGFSLGRIFINGEDGKGYGGGICQVSGTLYNAVLNAGLEIVERHPHSKPVYYVEKNKDAATSYGGKDLKFKNTLPYPIKINSYVQDTSIYISLEIV